MSSIITVISTRIVDQSKRLIKVLKSGRDDIQEKNQILPYGFDSNPIKDVRGLYVETTEVGIEVIVGYVNTNQEVEPGESRIFSTNDAGDVQIFITLKKDGTIEFGDNADNLVRFSELQTAFNELKSDLNSLVTAYNSHIHITTATVGATPVPGIIAPTVSTGSPSTADISSAKIDELKCS